MWRKHLIDIEKAFDQLETRDEEEESSRGNGESSDEWV